MHRKMSSAKWRPSALGLYVLTQVMCLHRTVHETNISGPVGLLPDTPGCREHFPRHRRQRKPLVSDPGVHHGTRLTHVRMRNQ